MTDDYQPDPIVDSDHACRFIAGYLSSVAQYEPDRPVGEVWASALVAMAKRGWDHAAYLKRVRRIADATLSKMGIRKQCPGPDDAANCNALPGELACGPCPVFAEGDGF